MNMKCVAVILALGFFGVSAEETPLPISAPPAANTASATTATRVEIVAHDGAKYTAALLSQKDGVLQLKLDSGETKQEKLSDLDSLQFLPPAPSTTPTPPQATGSSSIDPKQPWTPVEGNRFRQLLEIERTGTLTASEGEELKKFREKLRNRALKTEQHFALELKLKKSQTEEEAHDALIMLAPSLRQRGGEQKFVEALRAEIETINRPEIRKKLEDKLPDIINALRGLKLDKKDLKKNP